MKHTLGLAIFLLTSASLTYADVTKTEEFDFDLEEGGRISLSNVNGDVSIEGVSGSRVLIKAEKKAGTQEYLDGIEIAISASPDSIRIETRHPKNKSRWLSWGSDSSGSVTYTLSVPESAALDSIDTVNGGIRISGVSGPVTAESVNGKLKLDGLKSDVKLDTVNGRITANFDEFGSAQRFSADAVNGSVTLVLPADANAEVHAETLNGGIDADDFGLEPDKGFVGRDLSGTIGAGEGRVDIDTVNGSITIEKSK